MSMATGGNKRDRQAEEYAADVERQRRRDHEARELAEIERGLRAAAHAARSLKGAGSLVHLLTREGRGTVTVTFSRVGYVTITDAGGPPLPRLTGEGPSIEAAAKALQIEIDRQEGGAE